MADGVGKRRDKPPAHNWNQYGLHQMYAMLERHSKGMAAADVDIWRRAGEMCEKEADALEGALVKLKAGWPVTQDASFLFSQVVTGLIAAMRGTAVAAKANGPVA